MRHNARAVRGPDGTVLHYEGAAEDITERTRADAALRHSRSRLEGIIGSVMDGIISVDADHTIVSFNAAAATIFLCPAVQAVGRPVEDFVPEWEHMERQGIARSFDDVVGLRGRRAVRREVIGVRTNGEEFPCEVSVSRVQVHAQHLYTIVARDISDRKRATRDLEKSREMLRALAARVESVREEERCAVAREIHDVLGGALTGLKMDLSWLAARLPAEATTLRDKVPGMFALIDGTVQSVRHLASSLRPGILDDLGLGPAIEWQAHEIQARVGIPCECSVDTAGVQLDPEQSTAMFRILQESLTNVARHANATRVSITLRQDTDCIVLQVTDNGQGITADEIHDPGSLGLLGMRERARLLGGDVTFAGHPGRGTVVDARIPVRRPTTRPETREPSEGAVPQDNDPSVESTAGTL